MNQEKPTTIEWIFCELCEEPIPTGFQITEEALSCYEYDHLVCSNCLDSAIRIEDIIEVIESERKGEIGLL